MPSSTALKYVLAIDMGSGSTKAAVVSSAGEVVASAIRHTDTMMMAGGAVEQDPEQWWRSVCDAAKEAIAASRVPVHQIIAVACTTLWAVTGAVDEDGAAIGNAISWMDTRGAKYNRAVAAGWPRVQGYGLFKLLKWLRFTGGAPVQSGLGPIKPEVAAELGLAPSTRVVMGSCDGHSATVGAGTVRDYEGYFYVGTTAWLSCHVPAKKTDPLHMLTAMPAALPGRYMVGAEQGSAGRCLEFLKDILYPAGSANSPIDVYADMNRLAAEVAPGSDGLIFTPWINGVLAPHEDASTRSAFFNQNARTSRGHYVRAVMEGVAYNLRWLKGYVEKFIGRPFEQLNFIGGGASSDLWC